ncbi:MAG: hypothetical protein JWQ43_3431, partial [Glaciihabitans sp.]|nr:hypothetical protein [Glaciihabitans sp.]
VCRFNAGTITSTLQDDGSYDSEYDGFDVDVIGVDAATGEIEWETALGSDPANAFDTDNFLASYSFNKLVTVEGSVSVINGLTGSLSAAPADGIFACSVERPLLRVEAPAGSTSEARMFNAGFATQPCDIGKTLLSGNAMSPGTISMATADAGNDIWVASGSSTLSGYPLESVPLED